MLFAGVDIGSLTTKAVILEDGAIREWALVSTEPRSDESAVHVTEMALIKTGASMKDLTSVCATGNGTINIQFAQKIMSEISCHVRGNNRLFPGGRTVLDLGGQDYKGIRCDANGLVTDFVLNDKCAAGTGRYLEQVASSLGLALEQIGPLSLEHVNQACAASNFRAEFTEEAVSKDLHGEEKINNILVGTMETIAERILTLLGKVGVEEQLCISGGVAKNIGVVERLERKLNLKSKIAPEPQIVGALGAALFAMDFFLNP